MEECALIEAARGGDQAAFTRLHQMHVGYVRGVARSFVPGDDVEDVCQETFLLAFTRLHSFEGSSQFRTWLTRIAVNQCLIYLRKTKPAMAPTDDADSIACNDARLEGVDTRMDLEKLLRRLRPEQRQVLEMAYLEDMPYGEIAAALNTTLFTVKGQLYQATRRIRKVTKKS